MGKHHSSPLDPHIDAKISELRKLLMTATDLDTVSDYFYNVVVSDDAFMMSGSPSSNSRLLAALEAVLDRFAPGGALLAPWLVYLEERALYHGYSGWGCGHAVFFYFEELDMGFCSYLRALNTDVLTLLRFNLTDLTAARAWGLFSNGRVPGRQPLH